MREIFKISLSSFVDLVGEKMEEFQYASLKFLSLCLKLFPFP